MSDANVRPPTEDMSMRTSRECESLLRWLLHVEQVFSTRTNFFLLAESIAVISFATLAGPTNGDVIRLYMTAVAVLGIVITLLWVLVQEKVFKLAGSLQDRLGKCWPMYADIKNPIHGFSNNRILGFLIPSVFLAFWVVLLIRHISSTT